MGRTEKWSNLSNKEKRKYKNELLENLKNMRDKLFYLALYEEKEKVDLCMKVYILGERIHLNLKSYSIITIQKIKLIIYFILHKII